MTTLVDQLAREPLRAAPGVLRADDLSLSWDLDRLVVVDDAGERGIDWPALNLQLSRSSESSWRGATDRLRVELRGPGRLRLPLCARVDDAAWLDGLPELHGERDHEADLDDLLSMVDTARASGASIAQIVATERAARVEVRARDLRGARWPWLLGWLAAAALVVGFAPTSALAFVCLWPGLALWVAFDARVDRTRGFGPLLERVLVSLSLLAMFALYASTCVGLIGLGLPLVTGDLPVSATLPVALPLLGHIAAQVSAWGLVRRLREYRRATSTEHGVELAGAPLTRAVQIGWHDPPRAAAALLSPASARLRRHVDVRVWMSLCDATRSPRALLADPDAARRPAGELRVVGRLHTGFLGDALRTLRGLQRAYLTALVPLVVVAVTVVGSLWFALVASAAAALARAVFAVRPSRTLALDPERGVLVERRGPLLADDPGPGQRVPAAAFFAPGPGVTWSAVSTGQVAGPRLEARGRHTGLRLEPHGEPWTVIPLRGLWAEHDDPDTAAREATTLCELAGKDAGWATSRR